MDLLDLNISRRKHIIDYHLSRIAHIKNEDFTFICYADLKRDSDKLLKLGALPVRFLFVLYAISFVLLSCTFFIFF